MSNISQDRFQVDTSKVLKGILKLENTIRSKGFYDLQSKSIYNQLKYRGFQYNNKDGFQALSDLSEKNMKRILKSISYSEGSIPQVFEDGIESLEIIFQHNTSSRFQDTISFPLMSSGYMEELGVLYGLNNFDFNKRLLRTNDQVFFFVLPFFLNGPLQKKVEYGPESLFLNADYANLRAMISLYVMYPKDLFEAMQIIDPAFAKKIAPLKYIDNLSNFYKREANRSDWDKDIRKAVKKLHLYDFTVNDFKLIIRTAIKRRLEKLIKRQGLDFVENQYLWRLEDKRAYDFFRLFEDEMHELFGGDFNFEGKVPIAIPSEQITHGEINL